MSRRTKKEKLKAKHPFLISWKKTNILSSNKPVKRQLEAEGKSDIKEDKLTKNANLLDKEPSSPSFKHNIIKSLILASLILGLELVIYLAWR